MANTKMSESVWLGVHRVICRVMFKQVIRNAVGEHVLKEEHRKVVNSGNTDNEVKHCVIVMELRGTPVPPFPAFAFSTLWKA